MALARTCVCHQVHDDLRNLIGSLLDDPAADDGSDLVAQFEAGFAEMVGSTHCVAFSHARSGVYFALRSKGFRPGTEIIMSPVTIRGMLDVVASLGLLPVFVDLDPDTLLFDVERLRAAITERTGAVLLTHLFGIDADPTEIVQISREAGLFVVEDFSHALGASASATPVGTFGDVGVYSSSVTKTLDAYGGGLAVTDSREIAAALREAQHELVAPSKRRLVGLVLRDLVLNVALRKAPFTAIVFPLVRLLRRCSPAVAKAVSGAARAGESPSPLPAAVFERMGQRQACTGLRQLPKVEGGNDRRREASQRVRALLESLGATYPRGSESAVGVFWQTVVVVDDVESFQHQMARHGIDVAPTKLSFLPGLVDKGDVAAEFPVAHAIKHRAVYLPCNPQLSERDLDYVLSSLESVLGPPGAPSAGATTNGPTRAPAERTGLASGTDSGSPRPSGRVLAREQRWIGEQAGRA